MENNERDHLLKEIEAIRTDIERLQPEVYKQQARLDAEVESSQSRLKTLRKELARDMDLLHARG